MNEVFELVGNDNEKVVIKVNANNPLVVAMHPYVSANMAYITVTKGKNHVLTTILKNGNHGTCFHWGDGGYTLISDGLKILKSKVLKFIDDCNICLELTSTIEEARLCFNSNFNSWQLTLNDDAHVWENKQGLSMYSDITDNDHGIEWGTNKLRALLEGSNKNLVKWEHGIAQTGIDVWYASIA